MVSTSGKNGAITQQQGFSYLFVVLMLLMISFTVLASRTADVRALRGDKEIELLAYGHEFRAALASYARATSPTDPSPYPATLQDLLEDNRQVVIKHHLRKLFVDPMTVTQNWGLVYAGGHIVGVYSRSALKPLQQSGFDPNDASFAGAQHYSDWVFSWPPAAATATSASP